MLSCAQERRRRVACDGALPTLAARRLVMSVEGGGWEVVMRREERSSGERRC